MPLQAQATDNAYIHRTRVYFSNEDQVAPATDIFNYTIALENEISNVIGCELVGFSMAKRLTPTFRGRYVLNTGKPYPDATNFRRTGPNYPAGNSIIDMRVIDETATITLDFAVDLDLVVPTSPTLPYTLVNRFLTMDQIGDVLREPIQLALDAQGDATLNTTNYTVDVDIDVLGRFYCKIYRIGDPTTQATVTFLFASGPNSTDSPHRVLGFDQVDTTPDPLTSGVQAEFAVDPNPVRYIDISIEEFNEFRPLSRIFVSDPNGDFKRPVDKPTEFRTMVKPVRVLNQLTVRMQFNDRQEYSYGASYFHEIALEIISLQEVQTKPTWVDQRFIVDH